ncbi:MarR family winged helix-turn-helix transcriptional regulator [Methylobacterium nigriterrae]|uniref:MarR family winged helix-turn-helix transcriptional regulator n=1 Tax=Methylobacterium nigriterrae TaxID=3127512 RepID=UPI00301388BA
MTKPLELTSNTAAAVEEACLCLGAQRIARAVGRQYDAALRPVRLSNWQFTLLMMLVRDDPLTISALAHALAMDRTTVTANLKPLERRGLLMVEVDAEDRRVRRVVLTDAGRMLLTEALPLWQKAQAACTRTLGDTGRAALRTAMAALST